MKVDIAIQPESDEEAEFLDLLTEARDYGLDETSLSEAEMAAVYSQFASGLATEFDGEETADLYCPECDEPVEDVQAGGMGQPPTCEPCGHEVEWSELPADLYD